jgi:hypothetical protein
VRSLYFTQIYKTQKTKEDRTTDFLMGRVLKTCLCKQATQKQTANIIAPIRVMKIQCAMPLSFNVVGWNADGRIQLEYCKRMHCTRT